MTSANPIAGTAPANPSGEEILEAPQRRRQRNKVNRMPVISKFYGIVIRMLFIRPFAAHFHAIYENWELVVAVSPVRIIQGDAPSRVCKMVLEWAAQHQSELLDAWSRLAHAQPPAAIEPLV